MEIEIWKPIEFSEEWRKCDTSKLDEILPSWLEKRQSLTDGSPEYKEFIERLKREHAIETGIIERLYDLREGITETFIKEGFVESYLQHGDTNIPPSQLMQFLTDNLSAVEFIFDVIKENRPITKGFLFELHQLVTQHQDFIDAIDPHGNYIKIPLLKGQFKKMDNNPKRSDGTKFLYCPPVQVDSEIENMLEMYKLLQEEKIHPVIIAAWLHHAFTIIHPFQDGNGRLARLLATLILVKNNLFPLTIKRTERDTYITALEKADKNEPQGLVNLFCEIQKSKIESILNWKPSLPSNSLAEVVVLFRNKLREKKQKTLEVRKDIITQNRNKIFQISKSLLQEIFEKLKTSISGDLASVSFEFVFPEEEHYYYYTHQIIEYAKKHEYFFNRNLPRGWFQFSIFLDDKKYKLIISIHHYGYDDSTIAIGSILLSQKEKEENDDMIITPLAIKPYTLSIIENKVEEEKLKNNLESYLSDSISIALAQILNEV